MGREERSRITKLDYTLKKYVFRLKSKCINLGFHLRVTKTPRNNMVLLSNDESGKVVLATHRSDVLGESLIFAYLINGRKYEWARAEGFSLDQMFELQKENVFAKIDSGKVAGYLL